MIPPSRTQHVGVKWFFCKTDAAIWRPGGKLLKFVIGFVFSVEIYIFFKKKRSDFLPKRSENNSQWIFNLCTNTFLQDPFRKTVIGLLDIYGFEVFTVNRWGCVQMGRFISDKRLSWRNPYWPRQWFQLRAVLHQLLQREVAAAFHSADSQVRAGRVWDGGDWSKADNFIPYWHRKKGKLLLFIYIFLTFSVGTSAIFQQQDNLRPCGGETQRNYCIIGKYVLHLVVLHKDI